MLHICPDALTCRAKRYVHIITTFFRLAISVHLFSFKLDEEKVAPARPWNLSPEGAGGVNQVKVCLGDDGQLDGYVVATTTCGPGGRESIETVEVRQLVDGGQAHIQVRKGGRRSHVFFLLR